jgi:hypothetical protein
MDINQNGKDDLQEIKDGFAQLYADAKAGNITAVATDVENGVAWTLDEIAKLTEDAQHFLTAVKATVSSEATSVDNAVERALNIINNPGVQQAVGLTEEAITGLKNLPSQALATAIGVVKSTLGAI